MSFTLPGLEGFYNEEQFTIDIKDEAGLDNINKNLKKWFEIKPLRKKFQNTAGVFNCNVTFLPMKPIPKSIINIIIKRKSGVTWKFFIFDEV